MSESAFGIDHGDFSKALPGLGGAAKTMFNQRKPQFKELGSGFKSGFKGVKLGPGTGTGVGKPPKTSFNTGLRAGGFARQNAKPVAAGVGVGGLGVGAMANTPEKQKLRQYR